MSSLNNKTNNNTNINNNYNNSNYLIKKTNKKKLD